MQARTRDLVNSASEKSWLGTLRGMEQLDVAETRAHGDADEKRGNLSRAKEAHTITTTTTKTLQDEFVELDITIQKVVLGSQNIKFGKMAYDTNREPSQ